MRPHNDTVLIVMAAWPMALITFLAFGAACLAPWLNKR